MDKFFTRDARRIIKVLKKIGYEEIRQEVEFKPYIVDLYLPKGNIGVELDGMFHFKKRDKKRDSYLKERYNLTILRFPSSITAKKFQEVFLERIKRGKG